MKINFVKTIIALAVSALIAYGLYSIHDSEYNLLLSIGSFIFLSMTLVSQVGIDYGLPRTSLNIRVVAGIFFVIALISNIVFSLISFTSSSYIIINGILLLIFLLIVYSIRQAKQ